LSVAMNSFFSRLASWLILLVVATGSFADELSDAETNDQAIKVQIRHQFEPIIQHVNAQLKANLAVYKQDPRAYSEFINQNLRTNWDPASTSSALIGRKQFQALDEDHRQQLVAAVDVTLVRYGFEGFEFYSGQQFSLEDIAISRSGEMAWLQVVMESPIIPDLNLDILIKRNDTGGWKAVDVRFQGITFVAVKKYQYRKLLDKQGIQGLIEALTIKNNGFFSQLCDLKDRLDNQTC